MILLPTMLVFSGCYCSFLFVLFHSVDVATLTALNAVQEGPTSIQVSWIPPIPLDDTTGYRIYYSGGSSGSEDVSGGSTHNHLLTGLQNGGSYNISMTAISNNLSSARVDFKNSILMCKSITLPYNAVTYTLYLLLHNSFRPSKYTSQFHNIHYHLPLLDSA